MQWVEIIPVSHIRMLKLREQIRLSLISLIPVIFSANHHTELLFRPNIMSYLSCRL